MTSQSTPSMIKKAIVQSLVGRNTPEPEELERCGDWDHGVEPDVMHQGKQGGGGQRQPEAAKEERPRHEAKEALDRLAASESLLQKAARAVRDLEQGDGGGGADARDALGATFDEDVVIWTP